MTRFSAPVGPLALLIALGGKGGVSGPVYTRGIKERFSNDSWYLARVATNFLVAVAA